MANEAKFSVVFPAPGIIESQLETFESLVQKNGLPVSLPLTKDSAGNYVVSSGLSLRDAQILRRQVSGYGFNADVVSDAVRNQSSSQDIFGGAIDGILGKSPDNNMETWASMEMPDLDLGLSDGADLDEEQAEWSGDNWLDPDASASRTISVNAQALLEVARSGDFSVVDINAVQSIPILENVAKGSDNLAEPLKALTPEMIKDSDEKPTVTNLGQLSIEDSEDYPATEIHQTVPPENGTEKNDDLTAVMDSGEAQILTTDCSAVPLLENSSATDADKNVDPSESLPTEISSTVSGSDPLQNPVKSANMSSRRRREPVSSTEIVALETPEVSKSKSKLPIFLVIIAVVLIAGIAGCYFLYMR